MPLAESDKEKTAFSVPEKGKYEFNVTPTVKHILKAIKCVFASDKEDFLGYELSHKGIKPQKRLTEAINSPLIHFIAQNLSVKSNNSLV